MLPIALLALVAGRRLRAEDRCRCRSSTAPKFPEFIAPAVPAALAGTPRPPASRSRGWRSCRPAISKNAEREFAAALKTTPAFYPAETGARLRRAGAQGSRRPRCRISIARSSASGATSSALVGRGQALLALDREADALVGVRSGAGRRSVARPTSARRVEVLQFRGARAGPGARARRRRAAGRLDEAARAYATRDRQLARQRVPVSRAGGRRAAAGRRPTRRSSTSARPSALDPSDARSLVQIGELLEARGDFDGAAKAYTDALAHRAERRRSKRSSTRVRARAELARLPAEYRAIEQAPQITRGDLAALIGVRLAPLLQAGRRRDAVRRSPTCATHWAGPGSWRSRAPASWSRSPTTRSSRARSCAASISRRRSAGCSRGSRRSTPAQPQPWQTRAAAVSGSRAEPPRVSGGVGGRRGRRDDDRRRTTAFQPSRSVTGAEAVEAIERLEALAGLPAPRSSATMTALTPANQLTLLRMLLIPAFVILVVYGDLGWALVVFATAGVTDALDGLIARRSGQKTSLGAWLDPMADKLLLVTTFVVLTLPGLGLANRLPIWLTVLIISRDVVIVADRGDREPGDRAAARSGRRSSARSRPPPTSSRPWWRCCSTTSATTPSIVDVVRLRVAGDHAGLGLPLHLARARGSSTSLRRQAR